MSNRVQDRRRRLAAPDSITTALDPDNDPDPQLQFGHAQPSIYARFEDAPGTGTDPVGDIAGHGYVKLTTDDPPAHSQSSAFSGRHLRPAAVDRDGRPARPS